MNGLDDSDHEQPTETTALLAGTRTASQSRSAEPRPTYIETILHEFEVQGQSDLDSFSRFRILNPDISLALLVLFHLRQRASLDLGNGGDISYQWTRERHHTEWTQHLDRVITEVWEDVATRPGDEIEEVLWRSFPYSSDNPRSRRVIDFLAEGDAPKQLLTHRLIHLSLLRVWKYGLCTEENNASRPRILIRKLDAICAPRVLHMIDLIFVAVWLFNLAYFLVLPPIRLADPTQTISPDAREYLTMLYSSSQLLRPLSFRMAPYLLCLLAFLSHLPLVPYPDDFAYGVLLFAFSWIILEMHLPYGPSPLFLLPFQQVLPLSVLIWHGLSRVFLPVVLFFLPALLLSLFLLSTSLADIFPQTIYTSYALPAPMESRIAFLTLLAVVFLLLLCSLVMLVLVYPALSREADPDTWDRYSIPIGLEARCAFIRTVVAYSRPYNFPPPFNAVQFIVRIPVTSIAFVIGAHWKNHMTMADEMVWRATVAPMAWIVAGFWLWGLFGF